MEKMFHNFGCFFFFSKLVLNYILSLPTPLSLTNSCNSNLQPLINSPTKFPNPTNINYVFLHTQQPTIVFGKGSKT
jgi:hypothetical protein